MGKKPKTYAQMNDSNVDIHIRHSILPCLYNEMVHAPLDYKNISYKYDTHLSAIMNVMLLYSANKGQVFFHAKWKIIHNNQFTSNENKWLKKSKKKGINGIKRGSN